jgi:hypothetical protein
VETTISNYIVPTGTNSYILGFSATGLVKAKYTIYLNTIPLLSGWTTASNLTLQMNFMGLAPTIAQGLAVQLKVIHGETAAQDFSGTIIGYEV